MSSITTIWPKSDRSTGVSTTISPVTHTADTEVKKASSTDT